MRSTMKISTKGRYAIRMMIDLAQHDNGDYISLKDVSGREGITVKYLEQIVIPLSRAGRSNTCATLPFWRGLEKVINDYVDGYTLQDLVDGANSLAGNDYMI